MPLFIMKSCKNFLMWLSSWLKMLWPLFSHFDIHHFKSHHKDQPILILIMSIKINHNMIFKDKISVRNCKYTKNIIYSNDVMIKFSYIVTNFIKSLHTICKSERIGSTSPNHVSFLSKKHNNLYARSYHDICPLSWEA